MGEDNKVLELGNVSFVSLIEEPAMEVPQITNIERVLGRPLEVTFELSRESVMYGLYNIMGYERSRSNNWYKLHGVKTARKLRSERGKR